MNLYAIQGRNSNFVPNNTAFTTSTEILLLHSIWSTFPRANLQGKFSYFSFVCVNVSLKWKGLRSYILCFSFKKKNCIKWILRKESSIIRSIVYCKGYTHWRLHILKLIDILKRNALKIIHIENINRPCNK